MTIFKTLKQLFLVPFWARMPTTLVGQVDQWALPIGALSKRSFVVSAGVGHSITFEQDIVRRFGAKIVLLDPSPTGLATIAELTDRQNIDFQEVGLADRVGEVAFASPAEAEEGSFRKGSLSDGISFPCTTLAELLRAHGRSQIDLLKIDVEGFEYEIIQSIFDQKLQVKVICVEIHHNRVIAIDQTIFDAARLILRLYRHGYRITYNKNMDFTFVKVGRPPADLFGATAT